MTQEKYFSKTLTYFTYSALVAMVMYPPWNRGVAGIYFPDGYNFITAYRYSEKMFINTDRLLVQCFIALILGITLQAVLANIHK